MKNETLNSIYSKKCKVIYWRRSLAGKPHKDIKCSDGGSLCPRSGRSLDSGVCR